MGKDSTSNDGHISTTGGRRDAELVSAQERIIQLDEGSAEAIEAKTAHACREGHIKIEPRLGRAGVGDRERALCRRRNELLRGSGQIWPGSLEGDLNLRILAPGRHLELRHGDGDVCNYGGAIHQVEYGRARAVKPDKQRIQDVAQIASRLPDAPVWVEPNLHDDLAPRELST